jgi:hypothetical protein
MDHVLASSRSLGIMVNPFMTRSTTTLLIARFLFFSFLFPLTFIYFIFKLFVSHIILTMLLAWLEVFMIPQPLQHLISHRSQYPFLLQMSRCGQIHRGIPDPSDEQVYDYGLYLMKKLLKAQGSSLDKFPPMPVSLMGWTVLLGNHLLMEQKDYDQDQQQQMADQRIPNLM